MNLTMKFFTTLYLFCILCGAGFAQNNNSEQITVAPPSTNNAKFEDLKSGMKDASIEASLLKATQARSNEQKWNHNYSEVKIISNGWSEQKNDKNGAVTGRSIDAYVYGVGPGGKCSYQIFTFFQSYDGKKFDENSTKISRVGQQYRSTCMAQ